MISSYKVNGAESVGLELPDNCREVGHVSKVVMGFVYFISCLFLFSALCSALNSRAFENGYPTWRVKVELYIG